MRLARVITALALTVSLLGGIFIWWSWRCPEGPWPVHAPLERLPAWRPDSEIRLVMVGDTQPQWRDGAAWWHPKAAVMRNRIRALQPELVVHVGDLVDAFHARARDPSAIPRLWSAFLDFYKPVIDRAPILPVRGNHDVGCGGFEQVFVLPNGAGTERYWTLDVGPVRLIALDTNRPAELVLGGRQARWFEEVVRTPAPRDTFVLTHHPPVSVGPTGSARFSMVRRLIAAHAERITAVFSGHDHLYHRSKRDGVRWFVTGGGGWYLSDVRTHLAAAAPEGDRFKSFHHVLLVEANPRGVRISCVDEHGDVFDQVEWSR